MGCLVINNWDLWADDSLNILMNRRSLNIEIAVGMFVARLGKGKTRVIKVVGFLARPDIYLWFPIIEI